MKKELIISINKKLNVNKIVAKVCLVLVLFNVLFIVSTIDSIGIDGYGKLVGILVLSSLIEIAISVLLYYGKYIVQHIKDEIEYKKEMENSVNVKEVKPLTSFELCYLQTVKDRENTYDF